MNYTTCPNCGDTHISNDDFINYEIKKEIENLKDLVKSKLHDQWIGIKEACTYTSLSESTLRRAVSNGTLKCSRQTGKLMFRISWVDKFMGGK